MAYWLIICFVLFIVQSITVILYILKSAEKNKEIEKYLMDLWCFFDEKDLWSDFYNFKEEKNDIQ
jgi:hypothetical protein